MAYKDKSDAYKYQNNYIRGAYDRVAVMLPKGGKDELQAVAAAAGESVNGYIKAAIRQRMERERPPE